MSKKILCLIDSLGSGGAERQMTGLAVLLKKHGYFVDLVSYHKEEFYAKVAVEGGVTPVILSVKNSSFSKLLAVRRFIVKNKGYDWVITYKDGPNIIGCLLKLIGIKFRLIVSERTSNKSRKLSSRNKLCYQLYRLADVVSPNSYSEGEYIKESYPWLRNKTKTITNFTTTDYFIPREKANSSNIKIVTAARISKTKNVHNYIKAIYRLKRDGVSNVHFDWYGRVQKGHEEYAKECMEMVKKYNLCGWISFHEASSDIRSEYQLCDAVCLPSIYEGFPNVICEAMSCGKPIVCSNVCDNSRIVKDGENGLLFNPNDVSDMVDKFKRIICMSKEERDLFGERSREIAESMFSEEAFIEKYIEIIEADSLNK